MRLTQSTAYLFLALITPFFGVESPYTAFGKIPAEEIIHAG
jgi:hypothetical protein